MAGQVLDGSGLEYLVVSHQLAEFGQMVLIFAKPLKEIARQFDAVFEYQVVVSVLDFHENLEFR